MEIETIFTDSKWKIITELSRKPQSPTQLAESTGTTLANISTQIRLLEAMDFIQEERLFNIAKGMPRKLYTLKKNFVYMVLSDTQISGKKMIVLEPQLKPFFNVWMIADSTIPPLLLKLYLSNEDYFSEVQSFGFLSLRGQELEILVIQESPEKGEFLNSLELHKEGKTFRIKAHLHTYTALEAGVENKDEYMTSLLKKVFIISDREDMLTVLKKNPKVR